MWKSNWSTPKKVLTRTRDTDFATASLSGKRAKVFEDLQKLQPKEVEWEAKRRRVAGGVGGKGSTDHTFGV